MAELSSRKTLVRAGTVGTATIGGGYLLGKAMGNAYDTPALAPLIGTGILAASGVAFFESQDTN